jgi:pSer/pThr/pTyr-binding forkhead associated (FHA) protein
MEKETGTAFLAVEKGEGDEVGKVIPLSTGSFIIGGCWAASYQPDIGFKDRCVSKRHAFVVESNRQFVLTDLHSKHGTHLNGRPLTQGMPYMLKNDDRIGFANGKVVLRFCQELESDTEGTLTDIDAEVKVEPVADKKTPRRQAAIVVNDDRKEVLVEGKIVEQIKGNTLEYRLLYLLHQNQGRAVDYCAIIKWLWAERYDDDAGPNPNNLEAELGEIEQVVYRLRNKLGDDYRGCVKNVKKFGYMLSLD